MRATKQRAKRFLQSALEEAKSKKKPQKTTNELAFWMKHAELDSVFQYLTHWWLGVAFAISN